MLLLYAMISDDVPISCAGITGIAGAEVRDIAKNGVRYFYSEWNAAGDTAQLKQQALEFHRVNERIMEHATLIPFRFPTSAPGEREFTELIDSTSSDYAQELQRLRGTVQMKVAIEGSSHAEVTATTGTEYLRQRQLADAPMNSALDAIRSATINIARETKEARRGSARLLFLLIDRDRIDDFRSALATLKDAAVPIAVSGPWPPSEFVNCYPDLSPTKK